MPKDKFDVIAKAKELAVHTYRVTSNTNRYPKKYRHSLVDKIQVKCLEIFETLLEANRIDNRRYKERRCEKITEAITYCEELLFYIELSMQITSLSGDSAAYWSKLTSDVKHMAIAWRTTERKEN